jgi:hypothetical protein
LKDWYAASTEDDSDLQARQPGAQNQRASGCDCKTIALSKVAPLRSVALNRAFASIVEVSVAFVESTAAAISVDSVSAVVVEPSAPQLETSKSENTKTKLRVNFFGECI